MTAQEKRRKAAIIAVSYYLSQEAEKAKVGFVKNSWFRAGKEVAMSNRQLVQRHGRALHTRG